MIEFRLLVDEIDYEKLARLLVPLLADKMKEKGGVASFLGGRKGAMTAMALQMIKTMDQSERDELLLRLVAEKSDTVVSKINESSEKKALGVHVSAVSAQKLP